MIKEQANNELREVLPGKEETTDAFLTGRVEDRLNDYLRGKSPTVVLSTLVAITLVLVALMTWYPSYRSGTRTGVGSLSSPTILNHTRKSLGDRSEVEVVNDMLSIQSFMDSVERFGVEGMEKIYLEKYNNLENE